MRRESPDQLRIALLSPKGPLYRRGGIFKQSLRYMPLTLPTLAALVPCELGARVCEAERQFIHQVREISHDLRPPDSRATPTKQPAPTKRPRPPVRPCTPVPGMPLAGSPS